MTSVVVIALFHDAFDSSHRRVVQKGVSNLGESQERSMGHRGMTKRKSLRSAGSQWAEQGVDRAIDIMLMVGLA